jgi:hypothetical protein
LAEQNCSTSETRRNDFTAHLKTEKRSHGSTRNSDYIVACHRPGMWLAVVTGFIEHL